MCGNIVGALYGEPTLNPTWLNRLELREVIFETGNDMLTEFHPTPLTPTWTTRYPDD